MFKYLIIVPFFWTPLGQAESSDISACIQQRTAAKSFALDNTDADPIEQEALKSDYFGESDYKTLAFFRCHGVEFSSEILNKQLDQNSEISSSLKSLHRNWKESFKLKRIELSNDLTRLEYKPGTGYVLHLSTMMRFLPNGEPAILLELDESHSIIKKLYESDQVEFEALKFTNNELEHLIHLYKAYAFSPQSGPIVKVRGAPFIGGLDSYLENYGDGYSLTLGSTGEVRYLAEWTVPSGHLLDNLNAYGFGPDYHKIFNSHVAKLYQLDINSLELARSLGIQRIELSESEGQAYLYGECSSAEDCEGLKLVVQKYEGPATDEQLVSARSLIDRSLIETLKFFKSKNVSLPNQITPSTAASLRVIKESWSDDLRIKHIKLTDGVNLIQTEWFFEDFNVVYLNPDHVFEAYPRELRNLGLR